MHQSVVLRVQWDDIHKGPVTMPGEEYVLDKKILIMIINNATLITAKTNSLGSHASS